MRSNLYSVFSIAAGLILLAVATWLWFGYKGPGTDVTLKPDDPEVVALGRRIYAAECASCHGEYLQGQAAWRQRGVSGRLPAPPHDASGHTWHHVDKQLFDLTKYGPAALVGDGYQSDMPAYQDTLSDGEIVATLSYIKSTWPEDVRRRHDLLNGHQRQ